MKLLYLFVAVVAATPIPADTKLRVTKCSMSSTRTDMVEEPEQWVPRIVHAADINF